MIMDPVAYQSAPATTEPSIPPLGHDLAFLMQGLPATLLTDSTNPIEDLDMTTASQGTSLCYNPHPKGRGRTLSAWHQASGPQGGIKVPTVRQTLGRGAILSCCSPHTPNIYEANRAEGANLVNN